MQHGSAAVQPLTFKNSPPFEHHFHFSPNHCRAQADTALACILNGNPNTNTVFESMSKYIHTDAHPRNNTELNNILPKFQHTQGSTDRCTYKTLKKVFAIMPMPSLFAWDLHP